MPASSGTEIEDDTPGTTWTLEADDGLALLGMLDQELVRLPLAEVVVARPFTGIYELGVLPALSEEQGIGQSVVEDHIRRPQ